MHRPGSCWDWDWDRDDSAPTHGEFPVSGDTLTIRVVSIETIRVVSIETFRVVTVTDSAPAAIAGMTGTTSVSVIRTSLAPTHSISVWINRAAGAGGTGTPRGSALTLRS